jgi:type IV pilus assembly protein PilB
MDQAANNSNLVGGTETVDLKGKEIPFDTLKLISKEMAQMHQMVAFEFKDGVLKIAMLDPSNTNATNAVQFLASKLNARTRFYKTDEESLKAAMKGYGQAEVSIDNLVSDYVKTEAELEKERQEREAKKKKYEKEDLASTPVAKVVNVILDHAVKGKASDIHVEPMENSLRVRYRVDGDLHESFKMTKEIASAVVSRLKIMSNLRIDEKRKPQDGRLKITSEGGKEIDVRVSILPTAEGEKVVMRLLEKNENLAGLESLGMEGRGIEVLKEAIDQPFGIILVTGPTGSGKSTTIFACLRQLNEIRKNILTLEDPVEYKVPGVNHCQVNPEIGFTFASGLRAALRQDPDIIMVGEIRDGETAELAIHAALTGHLVLSTLHTNDALGAIPRMVDMGIEAFLLSSSLRAVVAQRLVRKICDECKVEVEPTKKEREYVYDSLKQIPQEELAKRLQSFDINNFKLWKGQGCPKCNNSGTKGRLGIFEVVECDNNLKRIIDDDLDAGSLENEFKKQGAIHMKEDGVLKALNGLTTIDYVEEATAEDDQSELTYDPNADSSKKQTQQMSTEAATQEIETQKKSQKEEKVGIDVPRESL